MKKISEDEKNIEYGLNESKKISIYGGGFSKEFPNVRFDFQEIDQLHRKVFQV